MNSSPSLRRQRCSVATFFFVAYILAIVNTNHLLAAQTTPEPPPITKGPHGGRLLTDEDLQVEVTIFEHGVPAEFRIFLYEKNQVIDPDNVQLSVELHRLLGRTDTINFIKKDDYLVGDKVIEEPHSFDVVVNAIWNKRNYTWTYDSYEGRTTISSEEAREAGIVVESAGAAKIQQKLQLNGRVALDEDAVTHVSARFAGVVKEVRKRLGDKIRKGEDLAYIESNLSFKNYPVKSSINGTLIGKHIVIGESVSEKDTIFVVADTSKLFVDFSVNRSDLHRIRIGQGITIDLDDSSEPISSKIFYISPTASIDTQSVLVRARLPNASPRMVPGFYVRGNVITEKTSVPIAVKKTALQKYRDWDVVFIQDGDHYEIRPLQLGRQDEEWIEVVSGIEPNQKYVSTNSFIIKADIGKTGASHDH